MTVWIRSCWSVYSHAFILSSEGQGRTSGGYRVRWVCVAREDCVGTRYSGWLAMYNRARQLYKNISMLFLFPVKDGQLSTGVNATFNASCYG